MFRTARNERLDHLETVAVEPSPPFDVARDLADTRRVNGLGASACLAAGPFPSTARRCRARLPLYNGRSKYGACKPLGVDTSGYNNHGFSVLYCEDRKTPK